MKPAAEWLAEAGRRPDDFAPGELTEALAWVERVQADARTFSDAELEAMAAAAWNRDAMVKWSDFFAGPREPAKRRYIEDMRAAVAAIARPAP